jgi:ubiquitin-like protein Pup
VAREGGHQQRTTRKGSENEEATEVAPAEDVSDRKERLDEDVDAILDEIDDVLEENAEDFVRSFVQKGGQ